MCVECDRQPGLRHEHSVSKSSEPDFSHNCPGGTIQGVIPVVRYARSRCCNAVLAEGGIPETGFACTQCGKPAERVHSARTAHWKCACGVIRHQELADKETASG